MDPKGMKPPVPEGMRMPPMMQQMMGRMTAGMQESSPAMCRAMMTSPTVPAEMAGYAAPEVRTLFEEWASSVENEMLAVLKARGPLDLAGLAAALKISPESASHFLAKLVREGKATISGTQASSVA
jgi:hypothetical protein